MEMALVLRAHFCLGAKKDEADLESGLYETLGFCVDDG
jgi:hypothetical protein